MYIIKYKNNIFDECALCIHTVCVQSTCNDDWVSSGGSKLQRHFMFVFMDSQVVLISKPLQSDTDEQMDYETNLTRKKEERAFQDLRAETHFQRKTREWHWQDLSFETDIVGQRGLNNARFSPNPCSAQSLWGIGCNYTVSVSKTYSGDGFLFHSWPLCPQGLQRLRFFTLPFRSAATALHSKYWTSTFVT